MLPLNMPSVQLQKCAHGNSGTVPSSTGEMRRYTDVFGSEEKRSQCQSVSGDSGLLLQEITEHTILLVRFQQLMAALS